MSLTHLSQIEATRWNISHRFWSVGGGRRRSELIELGGRVIYRLEDVEAFEAERSRGSEAEPQRQMSAPGSFRELVAKDVAHIRPQHERRCRSTWT